MTAEGRISPQDLGIYLDAHVEMLARIVRFVHAQGSAAGMQLAHAGRKGSTPRPWMATAPSRAEEGGWQPVGPTERTILRNAFRCRGRLQPTRFRPLSTRFGHGGEARIGRRLRRAGAQRRSRLPCIHEFSVAADQHADGSIRRIVR